MDYQFLLLNLCDLFVVVDVGVDDDDLARLVMELGFPSISNVHLVKDRGNSLFREGNFVLAARHYTQALKLLCFLGLPPVHDHPAASSLCLSLVLNLAGCELKLSHYNQAVCYCTFVLSFDPSNVKALFRRGQSFKHLKLLNEAVDDFEHAVKLEPHNKDVNRKLLCVADLLLLNVNGKRVSYPFNPLGSDKKGKKPLLANDVINKFVIPSELDEASCSSVPLVRDDVSPVAAITTSPVAIDSEIPFASDSDIKMDFENLVAATSSGSNIFLNSESLNEAYPALPAKDDSNPSNSSTRPRKYSFSNKKHPNNNLRLSSQDYENLLLGRNLLFFHQRSLSSLKVRPLISSNVISAGTPHEEISREAAVPIPFPLHEDYRQLSHSHLGSESDELGHEESDSHIAKKKRLSSDTSVVSKVSLVEFQFVAVIEKSKSSMKCCRKVQHSIRGGRMAKSGVNSRKRSQVSIDNLPSFCRYTGNATSNDVAVNRPKRKEADLLPFEDYYHPPFKKFRISVSVGLPCNFRSFSSISSSFGSGYLIPLCLYCKLLYCVISSLVL